MPFALIYISDQLDSYVVSKQTATDTNEIRWKNKLTTIICRGKKKKSVKSSRRACFVSILLSGADVSELFIQC